MASVTNRRAHRRASRRRVLARAAGLTWADPVVGMAITVAIAFVLKDAAREV